VLHLVQCECRFIFCKYGVANWLPLHHAPVLASLCSLVRFVPNTALTFLCRLV
jgi:hypothetical protein